MLFSPPDTLYNYLMTTHFSGIQQEDFPFFAEVAHRGGDGMGRDEAQKRWERLPLPGGYRIGPYRFTLEIGRERLLLKNPPPVLSAAKVTDALAAAEPARPHVMILSSCDSTSSVLKTSISGGRNVPAGMVIAAETQTAGRGRWGRTWSSPPFLGLWFSIWCPKELDGAAVQPAYIPAAFSLAVVRALSRLDLASPVSLYWPNDFVIDRFKIGGMLVDQLETGLIVGIGLNVSGDPGTFIKDRRSAVSPASLSRFGARPPARNLLLANVVNEIHVSIDLLREGAYQLITRKWRASQQLHLQHVSLDLPGGSRAGVVEELDPERGIRLAGTGRWYCAAGVTRLEELKEL